MKLYLKVTLDELETPIAVAESVQELAELIGVSPCTIRSALSKDKHNLTSRTSYRVVEIEDD